MHLGKTIAAQFEKRSERAERARAEINFRSIQGKVRPGSKVLDVGAWSCYLGEMLRERMGCEVLCLDVVDANRTDLPFQLFDGKTLPVESLSFDVILFLYVLHHAADDAPLLREAARAIRGDGSVLIAEDSVDGIWNRAVTVGFHGYLWLVTKMSCDGTFRTAGQWQERFHEAGLAVRETVDLGRQHWLWPSNVLFVAKSNRRAGSP